MKARAVPLRMCLGCRVRKDKRDFVRVVRTPEGEITVDTTRKRAGRGAYICPAESCLHKAVKSKSFERAFGVPIGEEIFVSLKEQLIDQ